MKDAYVTMLSEKILENYMYTIIINMFTICVFV